MTIINKDFHYSGLEVDYTREYHCHRYGCDNICRCSTIVDSIVKFIDINQIVDKVYSLYFDKSKETKRDLKLNSILNDIDKKINLFTIDRILRLNRAWDKENWEINIENSYYGEEIHSVILQRHIAEKVESNIEDAILIENLSNRIEFLLKLEYGYILPELIGKSYKVDTIKKEDIIFGSEGHYRKIQTEKLEHYSDVNYKNIRGIVIKKDDKYKLIDGYHRCYSTNKKNITVLIAH